MSAFFALILFLVAFAASFHDGSFHDASPHRFSASPVASATFHSTAFVSGDATLSASADFDSDPACGLCAFVSQSVVLPQVGAIPEAPRAVAAPIALSSLPYGAPRRAPPHRFSPRAPPAHAALVASSARVVSPMG